MVLLAVVTLLLFGVPLALAVQRVVDAQALVALQRDATRAVATVPDNTLERGSTLSVPKAGGSTRIGLYDASGRRLAGHGPARSRLALAARGGKEQDGTETGELVVVSPVLSDAAVAGSVRASVPRSVLRLRAARGWGGLVLLALAVVLLTSLLARRAARRIATPFEQLTAAAGELGAGSFELTLPVWRLAEADAAGQALQDSARRLGDLVRREREFVRDASHQLRTPLAGLVLQLEGLAAREPAAAAALERAHQLERTIADLLVLRAPGRDCCDPLAVVRTAVSRWNDYQPGDVVLRSDEVESVALPPAALRQALEVLLDNAHRHGAGPVVVTVEPLGDSVVVEVADQGPGFAPDVSAGTGLRLAAGIVDQYGGDLLIRRRGPHPRVALLLPSRVTSGQSTSNR